MIDGVLFLLVDDREIILALFGLELVDEVDEVDEPEELVVRSIIIIVLCLITHVNIRGTVMEALSASIFL